MGTNKNNKKKKIRKCRVLRWRKCKRKNKQLKSLSFAKELLRFFFFFNQHLNSYVRLSSMKLMLYGDNYLICRTNPIVLLYQSSSLLYPLSKDEGTENKMQSAYWSVPIHISTHFLFFTFLFFCGFFVFVCKNHQKQKRSQFSWLFQNMTKKSDVYALSWPKIS